MRVYIRSAHPSDRDVVLKFTEHTWEWGDYISDVWDRWLDEPKSRLLAATIDGVPVGVCHVVMVSADEAWLEGMRVSLDFRRLNIATKLTERSLKEAASFGAKLIRFITSSDNTPIHRLAAMIGFQKTVIIQPMRAATLGIEHVIVSPKLEDFGGIVSFIEKSSSYGAMGGLYSNGWRFLQLTSEEIKSQLIEGNIRIIANGTHIESVAIVETRWDRKALGVSYAGGDVDSLARLASDIRAEAGKLRLEEVNARLADTPEIAKAFGKAGFAKSDEPPFWIFEKRFTRIDSVSRYR